MKSKLKWVAWVIATILVSPLILLVITAQKPKSVDSRFQGCGQLLSLIPFSIGTYLRAAYYSCVCKNTDREIAISFLTLFSHKDTQIGKNTYIGPQSNIGRCEIGKDCLFGSSVHVLSGKNQHAFDDIDTPIREQSGVYKKISIGENCWIGNHATIMANVGSNSVIAAGSVVTTEIPNNSIAAGNPATVVRLRG